MKKIISILLFTSLFAGNIELDGDVNVEGQLNAFSFVGDGSGLTNLPSLGGMQPDRIYQKIRVYDEDWLITVPAGKIWIATSSGGDNRFVSINGVDEPTEILNPTIFFDGNTISAVSSWQGAFVLTIYEYNISTSGTDQGMDYIEP